MSSILSKRIQELKPSPTLALAAKAKELKAQGLDVISLTVGEPDWPTYDPAKQGAKKAIDGNQTTYTPAGGIPSLKEAIAHLVGSQLQRELSPAQVTVSAGAKYSIYGALNALLEPGDEVVIPSPYWVSYPTMVELAQGQPIILNCGQETDFKMTGKALEGVISPRTKAVLINSPSNPTGAEYTESELQEVAQVLDQHPQVVVLSDDIYNQLSFTGAGLSPHLLHVAPHLFDRCLCINGVSKAYAMTGWRIGWVVGPEAVVKAMASFQSQTTGASSSISQWASLAALKDCKDQVKEALKALTERKDFFLEQMAGLPGLEVFAPQGAFYLWVKAEDWIGQRHGQDSIEDSRKLAQLLLEKENLAVVPGQEFGLDGYLRLSFAARLQDLKEAAGRLASFHSQIT